MAGVHITPRFCQWYVPKTNFKTPQKQDPKRKGRTVSHLVIIEECINTTRNTALCLKKGLRFSGGLGHQKIGLQLVSSCKVVEGRLIWWEVIIPGVGGWAPHTWGTRRGLAGDQGPWRWVLCLPVRLRWGVSIAVFIHLVFLEDKITYGQTKLAQIMRYAQATSYYVQIVSSYIKCIGTHICQTCVPAELTVYSQVILTKYRNSQVKSYFFLNLLEISRQLFSVGLIYHSSSIFMTWPQ